jgi:hypothetical protein
MKFAFAPSADCAGFDSTNKALLLEMAQAWIRLAEQQKVEGEEHT